MQPRQAAYWNDESIEQGKSWWVTDEKDGRLLDHLRRRTNLERCFRDALVFINEKLGGVRGTVIEPGVGVCWTSAILSMEPGVERVEAIDCSRHRLFKIAPIVFRQYGAAESKIDRRLGDMEKLSYPDASVDLVIFCQALYMTADPGGALAEARRALKPGGIVAVVCERIAGPPTFLQRIRSGARTLLGGDPSGRIAYLDEDYRRFLRSSGFQLHVQELSYPVHPGSSVPAVNYFGIKPQ